MPDTPTTPAAPVLDPVADPVGYNADKLRALAGSLATRRGCKDAARCVVRAVDACLAALTRGYSPASATSRIRDARRALKTGWDATRQALEALDVLEAKVRAVPLHWIPGTRATLAGAAQAVRRGWGAAARLGIRSALPGVYAGGERAPGTWTDGKALVYAAEIKPALLRAVAAQDVPAHMAAELTAIREGLARIGAPPQDASAQGLWGRPWADTTTPWCLVRHGNVLAVFSANNVAILAAHGAVAYRVISGQDMNGKGSQERTILAAWDAAGAPVGIAMPISYQGKEAQLEDAALAAGATWGAL
jgi:hypothetical protein